MHTVYCICVVEYAIWYSLPKIKIIIICRWYGSHMSKKKRMWPRQSTNMKRRRSDEKKTKKGKRAKSKRRKREEVYSNASRTSIRQQCDDTQNIDPTENTIIAIHYMLCYMYIVHCVHRTPNSPAPSTERCYVCMAEHFVQGEWETTTTKKKTNQENENMSLPPFYMFRLQKCAFLVMQPFKRETIILYTESQPNAYKHHAEKKNEMEQKTENRKNDMKETVELTSIV